MVNEFEKNKLHFKDENYYIDIKYDENVIGKISLEGQIKINDDSFLKNKNYIRKIRKAAKNYFESFINPTINEKYKEFYSKYEVEKLYKDDNHNIYYMLNKKDYNKILGYITEKPEAIIVDNNLPKTYLNRFFKAYCFSNRITGKPIIDTTIYTNEQLNILIYAYINNLDATFIKEYLKPNINWKGLYILSLSKEYSFKQNEIDYLYTILLKNNVSLAYCVFKALLNDTPLVEIEKLSLTYSGDFLNEILFSLSDELKYFELEKVLKNSNDTETFIKNKDIYLKKISDSNLNDNNLNFKNINDILSYPLINLVQNKKEKRIENHNIFKQIFSKPKQIEDNLKVKFDINKVNFIEKESEILIEYNKDLIGKILKDKHHIFSKKEIFQEKDLEKIEELIYSYIAERPKYFIEENNIMFFKKDGELIFYKNENSEKIIVSKIFKDNKIELYFDDLLNIEKEYIYFKWLFQSDNPIFNSEKFNDNQKDILIKGLVKDLKLEDILIYANPNYPSDKMEHILFYIQQNKENLDELINDINTTLGIKKNEEIKNEESYLKSFEKEIGSFIYDMERIKSNEEIENKEDKDLFDLIKKFIKDDVDIDVVKKIIEENKGS